MAPAPPELKATALRELSALPEGDRVCHGDFHPGNVLVSGSRFVVIDWTNATSGHPVGDIALSCLLLLHAEPLAGPTRSRLLGLGRAWVERAYLSEYSRVRTIDPVQLTRWIPILAVARLSENIVGERQILIELARKVFAAAA